MPIRFRAFELFSESERAKILETWRRPGAQKPWDEARMWAFPLTSSGKWSTSHGVIESAYTLQGVKIEKFWVPEGGEAD